MKNSTTPTNEPTQQPTAGEDSQPLPQREQGNLFRILLIAFTLFVLMDIAIVSWFLLAHKRPSQCVLSPGMEQNIPHHHGAKEGTFQ